VPLTLSYFTSTDALTDLRCITLLNGGAPAHKKLVDNIFKTCTFVLSPVTVSPSLRHHARDARHTPPILPLCSMTRSTTFESYISQIHSQ
jgi:hypothetical protein